MHSQIDGITIPTTHPRLWWNTARLAQAKTWWSTNSFTPASDDPLGNAFAYLMTGNTAYAQTAINWLVAYQFPPEGVTPTAIGCDVCRWDGETLMLVYDWCYDQMTAAQRSSLISYYDTSFANVNQQSWGGVGMEGNNYYWGNLRNSMEWGIASYGDNSQAQSFLDNALVTRWQNSFIPYANDPVNGAKGGVLPEGPGYSSTMLQYPLVPFTSAQLMGRDIYSESNYYKEVLTHVIYMTLPALTTNSLDSIPYYTVFTSNDFSIIPGDGGEDLLTARNYYGDFMRTMATALSGTSLGQYAAKFVGAYSPSSQKFIHALDQSWTTK